uniref:Uncharacterized protein n=1 Tax=Xiphophorus couchianus TaxID=32473 RepID=A0A3B5LCW7_9TELE
MDGGGGVRVGVGKLRLPGHIQPVGLFNLARQRLALPGSVFNLAPPHMFGNRLNPNSSMAALIAQSEASPADQEVGDGSGGSQGFSIRASPKTTPSPIGGLQIRAGGVGETLPPVATSIEQLLERQWNEGQSFLLQQGAQGDEGQLWLNILIKLPINITSSLY